MWLEIASFAGGILLLSISIATALMVMITIMILAFFNFSIAAASVVGLGACSWSSTVVNPILMKAQFQEF